MRQCEPCYWSRGLVTIPAVARVGKSLSTQNYAQSRRPPYKSELQLLSSQMCRLNMEIMNLEVHNNPCRLHFQNALRKHATHFRMKIAL